jgi:hypothetical protein
VRVIVGSLSLAYFFLNFLLASSLLLEESCAADTPPFYYNFPSHNFFRNFFAKSFVDSIIFVTFAVSYLAESSIWAKAGWTYIHKGVTVRFGFDVSESRKFNLSVKNKATGTPHGVYHIYNPY